MGTRLSKHLVALCVPVEPERWTTELAPNDASATGSDYTQAGPRPGASVPRDERSRLVPVISGAQGEDVEIVPLKGGQPALGTSGSNCELGYRFADETDEQIRGWTPPNMLTTWTPVEWTDATTYDRIDCCTIPGSQKVVVTYAESGGDRLVKVFDPGEYNLIASLPGTTVHISNHSTDAIVALPNGRVLCMALNAVYRSDDEGATWTEHARDVFGEFGFSSYDRGRMAYSQGAILYCCIDGANCSQLASDDLLASLTEVETISNLGTSITVAALPTGGFVVGYVRNSDSYAVCRVIPSAWSPLSDADVIEIRANTSLDIAITADPDGMLWAHVNEASNPHLVRVWVSTDGGSTWVQFEEGALRVASTNADYLTNWASTASCGSVHLIHNWVASTGNEDGSVGMAILGGWGSLTSWRPADDTGELFTHRTGWGPSAAGHTNRSWIPIELPGDSGLFTAAGAGTDLLIDGFLRINTAANTRTYTVATHTQIFHAAVYQLRVDSGGALGSAEVGVRIRVATGSHDYELEIRHTTAGFRIRDLNAASNLADVAVDLTADVQIAVRVYELLTLGGFSAVWYRTRGARTWTRAWLGQLTDDTATPAAAGQVVWGHLAAGTAQSRWRMFCDAQAGILVQGLTDLEALGRPLSQLPIPLPPEVGSGGEVAWLAAVAGPAAVGEVYDVPADHDHAIDHVFPTRSPSPAETWRGTRSPASSAEVLAWDFTRDVWQGDSIALVALGCNFRLANLQVDSGGVWGSLGQLDLATGFAGLDYAIAGNVCTPGASTPAGSRWVQEGELRGGYVVIETGGGASQIARRIGWNTAGQWVSSGAPRVRLQLEGCDGTEDATGQIDIVWPSGVLVVHRAALLTNRRWRIQLPSGQVTPDAYFQAGILTPMAVRALGAPPDWGWSREYIPNAETRRSRYGTTRARKLGPTTERWVLGWPSGVDLFDLRRQTSPNYVGSSVGLPLAGDQDVPWLLRGLLDLADSGAVPVLGLAAVPDASETTITDRSLYCYGRLTSSVRHDNLVGTEGYGEVARVPDLVVEGIV